MFDDQARQIVVQQHMCVATGTGPDGAIDGTLMFGRPGSVQLTDTGVCRFPLKSIEEGSPLRAWLRMSHHSGKPVPWALSWIDRATRASVLLRGAARLVPGDDGAEAERSASLIVEITPIQVTRRGEVVFPEERGTDPGVTSPRAADTAIRTMAQQGAKELTMPVREFLARCTDSFLCSVSGDGPPQIEYFEAAFERIPTQDPDIVLDQHTLYLRTGGEATDRGDTSAALLIVPKYDSQLAVRIAGTTRASTIDDLPAGIKPTLDGATDVLAIELVRVDVQAGDWSSARASAESNGNARVDKSVLRVHGARSVGRSEVSFLTGPTVLARGGESLLELAEANGVSMEAGCRMGICGADPVRIDLGAENLSKIRRSEQSTLDRLGLPPGCRMACSARVQGSVAVTPIADLSAEQPTTSSRVVTPAGFSFDPEVRRVVVIGTGIAGITVVEEVRKLHPDVEITVLGAERHDFYNRMAISRLVDEDTTPDKLSLMSSDWARRRRVLYLPGVSVVSIDRNKREVIPAEGMPVAYDRLVLAMGALSRIPAIEGIGHPGVFALRTIDDALELRRHAHQPGLRRAVVVGGGLLGLEAAYHLVRTGLRVWIVGRAEWPANRQLDEHAGRLLSQMLQDLGIEYVPDAEPRRLIGRDTMEGVELMDGRVLPAGLCLLAAGIQPDSGLARDAHLEVVQGVVVDDHMKTADPAIYAAGDVIEYRGRTFGLWPASVDQGLVAATNLLGGDLPYNATMAPAQLKVPGIDLLSVGEIASQGPDEQEMRIADRHARRYRKLVLRGGHAIGAILIGSPSLFDGVADAVQTGRDLSAHLDAIERGDWSSLAGGEDGNGVEALSGAIDRKVTMASVAGSPSEGGRTAP